LPQKQEEVSREANVKKFRQQREKNSKTEEGGRDIRRGKIQLIVWRGIICIIGGGG